MEKIYLGIDPGLAGGMAVVSDKSATAVINMPQTPKDILDWLTSLTEFADEGGFQVVAVLEDVGHGMPGQSSSATAKFARHCGHIEMALLALGIHTETVTPQKWQKTYQLGKSKEYTKTQWKNRLKAKAQQLFPDLGKKVTLSTADALLIAEYGRRTGL